MIFSLHKLKKKKSGQGSLIAICLGSVILSTVILGATAWYLSMNKVMSGANEKLEAISIAISEWQRLEHMSLDELEANRDNYKNPYDVGEKFKVGINLGEQGFFDEGKCNSLTGSYASENANCFKDTIMTVYDKDGSAMYTTRSLPLSVSRDSFPEGTILPYTGDLAKIPHGWVLCDGNNGTPDLTGRFLEGTKTTTGEFKMAGLPNITGDWEDWIGYQYPKTSNKNAFYTDGVTHQRASQDSGYYGYLYMYFDASRSNPVYGRSETVQPPAYTVFYIMKTNTDFHYNHTNPADTPSFYTKAEVDELLKNTQDKIADNYLHKNSKAYVRNLNESQLAAVKFDSESNSIHGFIDGTDKPFNTEIKEMTFGAVELGWNFTYKLPANGILFMMAHNEIRDFKVNGVKPAWFTDLMKCGHDSGFVYAGKKGETITFLSEPSAHPLMYYPMQ